MGPLPSSVSSLMACLYARRTALAKSPLPVLVLTGFLGAGKTALVEHVMRTLDGGRLAVLCNDLARVDVDGAVLEKHRRVLLDGRADEVVGMSGGCVCCTLRSDFVMAVCEILLEDAYDYLIVEPTGIADAMEVAMAFEVDLAMLDASLAAPAEGTNAAADRRSLKDFAYVDAVVAVVDASDDGVIAALRAPAGDATSSSLGPLSGLVREQVSCATAVLLNKADAANVDASRLAELRAAVAGLAPDARILDTTYARAAGDALVYTFAFEFPRDFARSVAAASAERGGAPLPEVHISEAQRYGVTSDVASVPAPLSAEDIRQIVSATALANLGVLRAKGVVWIVDSTAALSGDDDRASKRQRRCAATPHVFSLAGRVVTLNPVPRASDAAEMPPKTTIALLGAPLEDGAAEECSALFARCIVQQR